MLTALSNTQIVTDGTIITGKAVLIEGSIIKAVVDESEIPEDSQIINLNGNYVASGLIDLQIYGSGGKLFGGKPEVEALQQMEHDMLQQGTVGFMATIATNSDEIVEQGINAAKQYRSQSNGCFLGLHLEGPFLNPIRRGAHPERFIKKATLEQVQQWIEMAEGEIKIMTIAPELQDEQVISYLNDHGVIISSGHSNATYEQGKAFIHNPVKAITHLFNAMPQIHHRDPGIIPAIFEERPYTSIVADGIHVNFAMIRLAKRELGDKLFLITDAVTEATEGTYQHKFTGDRYVMPDGTLSGSCLTMIKAVKNCVEHCGIDLAEAVNMASLYPARLAGLNKGKIGSGCDADLIIFNYNLETQATVFKGSYYSASPITETNT